MTNSQPPYQAGNVDAMVSRYATIGAVGISSIVLAHGMTDMVYVGPVSPMATAQI